MKRVLILGAGLVTGPMVSYLLNKRLPRDRRQPNCKQGPKTGGRCP